MAASSMPAAEDLVSEVYKELMKKQVWLAPDPAQHRYKIGNKVWLSTNHLIVPGSKKFREKYVGPYAVLDTPSNAVHLRLPTRIWIHPTINIEQVKPYHDPIPGQHTHCSRPEVILDEE